MRTNNFLRIAALSLALAAPSFGSAYAHDIYNPQTVVNADPAPRTDAGQALHAKDIYDQGDRNLDQRTGLRLPGLTFGGY